MGKTQYRTLQRLIRDNGVRYVAGLAMDHQDIATLAVIDHWVNQCIKPTDWLAVRQRWIKTEKPAVAIRLTTWIGA